MRLLTYLRRLHPDDLLRLIVFALIALAAALWFVIILAAILVFAF